MVNPEINSSEQQLSNESKIGVNQEEMLGYLKTRPIYSPEDNKRLSSLSLEELKEEYDSVKTIESLAGLSVDEPESVQIESEPQPITGIFKPRLVFSRPFDLKDRMLELAREQSKIAYREKELEKKFNIRIRRGQLVEAENLEAYRTLESVLLLLPASSFERVSFKPGLANGVRENGSVVDFKFSISENELHDYLVKTFKVDTVEEKSQIADSVATEVPLKEPEAIPSLDLQEPKPIPAKAESETRAKILKFRNATDLLKDKLGPKYKEFMQGTIGMQARSLNRIQNLPTTEFLSYYDHNQISPTQKEEYKTLTERLNDFLTTHPDLKKELEQETIKDVLLKLAA
jgi:hypothetical protein